MSGYLSFSVLNMASAASRSPGAVHQWKISSLRSPPVGTLAFDEVAGVGVASVPHAVSSILSTTRLVSTIITFRDIRNLLWCLNIGSEETQGWRTWCSPPLTECRL